MRMEDFLFENQHCLAVIMIAWFEGPNGGTRDVLSRGRDDKLAIAAGFPATDIHERMAMSDALKARLDRMADVLTMQVGDSVSGLDHESDFAEAKKVILRGLMASACIDIPESLGKDK